MQYKIKNIPIGGEISDLTVSVKKGGGVGQYVHYNKELWAENSFCIYSLQEFSVVQNFSL
jgi:hypothetical protein